MEKTKQKNNMNKVIDFIKYHNAFTIGLVLLFVFSGVIFASEDLRDAVIGEETITETGVDNTALLAADLENFDVAMIIDAVSEDEEKYYVDYSFNTLGIVDNIWQKLTRTAQMIVSKSAITGMDLGLYLAEELGEVIDYQLAYLLEAQTVEKEKGQTRIVETTDYTGLIGLVLDSKTKILPGYEIVVKPPEPVDSEEIVGEFSPKEQEETFEPEPEPEPEVPVIPPEIPPVDTTTQSQDGI